MNETPIKLWVSGLMGNTILLQSQLATITKTNDFVFEDNVLKHYEWRPRTGYNFYEIDIPYTIINNIEEMKYQAL